MRSNIGAVPGGPHIPFHSPPLRRLLAGWQAAVPGTRPPAAAAGHAANVAERLGQWLAWTDAVELSAALNQPPLAVADAVVGAPSTTVLAQALARLQADQARQISTDPVYLPGHAQGGQALDVDDIAPYRRAAQARQRAMATAVAPLRARLRAALAATSPALAQLAALDATLEAALAGHERSALAGVVGQIERRARALHTAGTAEAKDWRIRFHHDMQQALLAELQLRLEPLHGLLDALRQEQPA